MKTTPPRRPFVGWLHLLLFAGLFAFASNAIAADRHHHGSSHSHNYSHGSSHGYTHHYNSHYHGYGGHYHSRSYDYYDPGVGYYDGYYDDYPYYSPYYQGPGIYLHNRHHSLNFHLNVRP